tara:strand:- start:187 stop:1533 length:1347 start_codon:yes stop_codon:yes gene_type:complete
MNLKHKRLELLLNKELYSYDIPGLAVEVRHEGRSIFSLGLGIGDVSPRHFISNDTIFGVASLTKMVTAIIILQAQENKLLTLSDPISQYYPNLKCVQNTGIQVKHLLNHSSGFPGLSSRHHATNLNDPKSNNQLLTVHDLVNYLNNLDFEMLAGPGQILSYSNEGFCLLGGIIENIYNKPYPIIVKELIFDPLRMTRSFIGQEQQDAFQNLTKAFISWGNGANPKQENYWDSPLFYSAGGLMTTVSDMTLLISELSGVHDLSTFNQQEQLLSGSIPVASRSSKKYAYSHGVEIDRLDSENTLFWHTGERVGISSFVGNIIERKLSVALFANIADIPTSAIGRKIFVEILGNEIDSEKLVWPPISKRFLIKRHFLKKFEGLYSSLEMGDYRVSIVGEKLLLHSPNSIDEFRFDNSYSGSVAGKTFKFLCINDEKSYALALDLRVICRDH